jgi:hypothetical protein
MSLQGTLPLYCWPSPELNRLKEEKAQRQWGFETGATGVDP